MVKPLVTDRKIWQMMGVIFALLCIATFLFFYFSIVSLPIIFGIVMIFITVRLLQQNKMLRSHHETKWQHRRRVLSVLLFWVVIIFIFSSYLVNSLASIQDNFYTTKEVHVTEDEVVRHDDGVVTLGEHMIALPMEKIEHLDEALIDFAFHAILIVPLMFFYYFFRSSKTNKFTFELVPVKFRAPFATAMGKIGREMQHFVMHKIRISNFILMISAIFFYAIGMEGAFILALGLALLSTIPHLGILIGTAILGGLALIQPALNPGGDFLLGLEVTPGLRALLVVLFGLSLFIFQTYYAHHFIKSDSEIEIDTLLEIVLVLIGLQLLGVLGMFFAVPVFIVFKVVLQEFYQAFTAKITAPIKS